jgi:hypothetical protein
MPMPNADDPNSNVANLVGRAVAVVFGITFGGIGLAMIFFLWSQPAGFGSPPPFFKVVGTLIALPFMAFGAAALLGGLGFAKFAQKQSPQALVERLNEMGREMRREMPQHPAEEAVSPPNYTCPHCGAPLDSASTASPHGDVRCTHCDTWFSIYGK